MFFIFFDRNVNKFRHIVGYFMTFAIEQFMYESSS